MVIGSLLAAAVAAPGIVPLFRPWSGINCRQFELDLVSGRERVTRYLYWIPIHHEVRESPASAAIGAAVTDSDEHMWVLTNTFGPYARHSPHHAYHSASHQIRQLELVWDEFGYYEERRRESAIELLGLLRSTGSDSTGDEWIRKLWESDEQSEAR